MTSSCFLALKSLSFLWKGGHSVTDYLVQVHTTHKLQRQGFNPGCCCCLLFNVTKAHAPNQQTTLHPMAMFFALKECIAQLPRKKNLQTAKFPQNKDFKQIVSLMQSLLQFIFLKYTFKWHPFKCLVLSFFILALKSYYFVCSILLYCIFFPVVRLSC